MFGQEPIKTGVYVFDCINHDIDRIARLMHIGYSKVSSIVSRHKRAGIMNRKRSEGGNELTPISCEKDFTDILDKVGFVKGIPVRECHLYLVICELPKKLGFSIDEARKYSGYLFDEIPAQAQAREEAGEINSDSEQARTQEESLLLKSLGQYAI